MKRIKTDINRPALAGCSLETSAGFGAWSDKVIRARPSRAPQSGGVVYGLSRIAQGASERTFGWKKR
jgi:hypothetical protein